MKKSLVLLLLGVLTFWACQTKNEDVFEEAPEVPFNPFDTVNYAPVVIPPEEIDPGSFLGIHEFILSKYCNQPGCHDGSSASRDLSCSCLAHPA